MVEEVNIGFVPPQLYPPMLRRIAISIMPLNLRDIGGFINVIGPLLCPIQVAGQICGVSQLNYVEMFVKAMQAFGISNSMAVNAEVGLDEFSAIGPNHFASTDSDGSLQMLNPQDHDMQYTDMTALDGGEPGENVEILHQILSAKSRDAAVDTVALNAAHVILLGKKADDISNALSLAHDAIFSGSAAALLSKAVEYSKDTAAKK